MIRSMRTMSTALVFSIALAIAAIGGASAEAPAPDDSTPTVNDAEFARFVEKAVAPPANSAATLPAASKTASCDATQQSLKTRETIARLEADIARLRALQEAKWAEKGWTRKQAAAAGESVVLNGSGYNIKNAASP